MPGEVLFPGMNPRVFLDETDCEPGSLAVCTSMSSGNIQSAKSLSGEQSKRKVNSPTILPSRMGCCFSAITDQNSRFYHLWPMRLVLSDFQNSWAFDIGQRVSYIISFLGSSAFQLGLSHVSQMASRWPIVGFNIHSHISKFI